MPMMVFIIISIRAYKKPNITLATGVRISYNTCVTIKMHAYIYYNYDKELTTSNYKGLGTTEKGKKQTEIIRGPATMAVKDLTVTIL